MVVLKQKQKIWHLHTTVPVAAGMLGFLWAHQKQRFHPLHRFPVSSVCWMCVCVCVYISAPSLVKQTNRAQAHDTQREGKRRDSNETWSHGFIVSRPRTVIGRGWHNTAQRLMPGNLQNSKTLRKKKKSTESLQIQTQPHTLCGSSEKIDNNLFFMSLY